MIIWLEVLIMDVLKAIQERRSIRNYSDKPVEDEKLNAVLEAARLAPSGNNKQAWRFIAVKDSATRQKLQEACGGQKFVSQAPVIIAACSLEQNTMTCGQPAETVDVSIAVSYMTLEAVEQGLGTCWLGFYYEDKVKQILGIPDSARVVAVVPLGYPAETPRPRPRKTLAEVTAAEKF